MEYVVIVLLRTLRLKIVSNAIIMLYISLYMLLLFDQELWNIKCSIKHCYEMLMIM